MESGSSRLLDPNLYRRGQLISSLARWISVGLSLTALIFLWGSPQARPRVALSIGLGYLAVWAACRFWQRRSPRGRTAKVVHDVADALAVGLGAATSGGLESPIWLLLYPHVVAVSVRGGLAYALAFGTLDAAIVLGLTVLTPARPLGALHAVAILFCAFMGGTTSSYLHEVQRRLRVANAAQVEANQQLQGTLQAQAASQQEQEATLARLRESEERYRRLLERIQDGVVIVQDGRVSYANRHFAELLGHTPEGLAGVEFGELSDPGDRAALAERYRRWQQGLPVDAHFEARLRTRSGALRLASLRVGSAEFEGRRAVVATVRDVTRQREMEQDLKAHAERLAAINEIANAVNLNLTIDDILSVAAQEARRLVPFDRLTVALLDEDTPTGQVVAAGVAGRTSFERASVAWAFKQPLAAWEGGASSLPPNGPALLAQPGIRSLATVPLFTKERVIGSLNFGRLAPAPFSARDLGVLEPVARHIAIALDNARLLEAVRRRSDEFQSLLEIGRGVLERQDLQALLPLVTRSVNEVMGTRYCLLMLRAGDELKLAAHEGLEPEVAKSWEVLRLGQSLTGRLVRDGAPMAVTEMRDDPRLEYKDRVEQYGYRSFLGVPLRRGGEVLGSLEVITKEPREFSPEDQHLMSAFADQAAIALDNARLLAETRAHLERIVHSNRRLEDLDRMRREYLRNVSHEFRTPLTVVRGYSEFLLEDPAYAGSADVLRVMVESCDRVIDLVDTLMDVSRIEQGEAEGVLQVQDLDLREVTAASVDMLRSAAAKKSVRVELDFPDQGFALQGDRSLIHQVVRKLVDNAVKYSDSGGRVVVRGRAQEGEVTLEVEDGGIGIAPEHLPRIFEKFYMVDGGIARRVGGTGVGLYLVREIVRLHRGQVDVDSRPGEGSRFAVRLPRQQQTQSLRQAAWA